MSDAGSIERLRERLGEALLDAAAGEDGICVTVDREQIGAALHTLREDRALRFNFLLDLTVVDWPERSPRFDVTYLLAAVEAEPRGADPAPLRERLRVRVGVPADDPQLDSAVELFAAANWLEREAWDLYGVRFRGHPDLRRILLYDEFRGHPLRKDYPKRARQPLLRAPEIAP